MFKRSIIAALAAMFGAPSTFAAEPPNPSVIVLAWCHDASLADECGKDSPSRAAVRAEFAASPECAGLTLANDSSDAWGRWVLHMDMELHSGQIGWQLRTASYAPKPWLSYDGVARPREIVHRICTIVGHRGGNVVE
jgi:hypothetical protein